MKIGMSIGFGDIKMTGGLEKRSFSEKIVTGAHLLIESN